jgi:hypothetical protein
MCLRRRFGIELKYKLNECGTYDSEELAFWGECKRTEVRHSDELEAIADRLSAMSCGPGFLYTKEELEFVANKLIVGEDDAWEQMIKTRGFIQPVVISRSWLGKELQKQLSLSSTYDPAEIALWAENLLICYKTNCSKEFVDILEVLSWMKQKPGFVLSKKHLDFLAAKLIENDGTALQQMAELE